MAQPTPEEVCTAITECCGVPSESLSRLYILILLCSINNNTGGGGTPVPVVNLPAKSIPFGSVTVGYTALSFLDVNGEAREIGVQNNTNQDVELSYDGAAAGPIIPAGQFRLFDYAANGRVLEATDIYMKYLNGVAPTLGQVVIDGYY